MRYTEGLLVVLLALSFTADIYGQTAQATLTGRVTDVPEAPVEVTNTETNQAVRVLTDGTGSYTAPYLRPGTYSVAVEAPASRR